MNSQASNSSKKHWPERCAGIQLTSKRSSKTRSDAESLVIVSDKSTNACGSKAGKQTK